MPSTPSSTATLHAHLIVSIKHVNSATQHLPEPFRRLINVCCHIGFQQTTERHHVGLNAIRWTISGPLRFHKDSNLYRVLQLLIVTDYSQATNDIPAVRHSLKPISIKHSEITIASKIIILITLSISMKLWTVSISYFYQRRWIII